MILSESPPLMIMLYQHRKTLKKAFEAWSAVTGLRFLYTRHTPDIQIDFEQGNHGDGSNLAFDKSGKTKIINSV